MNKELINMKLIKKSLIMTGILLVFILAAGTIHAEDAAVNQTGFLDLSNQINTIEAGEALNLDKNYKFREIDDGNYVDGVTVSKDLTLKGNNKVIDGSGKARALYIKSDCKVSIEDVTFKNCYSESGGAAIYLCKNSNLILKNCVFTNNKVYNANGGVLTAHSSTNVDVHNCIFTNNKAIRQSNLEWNKFKRGMGSVFCIGVDSKLNLYDSTISNNNGYLSTCVIISNNEEGRKMSSLYANNCHFENNVANAHTAIYIDELGKCEVVNSVFKNNRATVSSSVIDLDGSVGTFRNCLFESNSGEKGGVFYIFPNGKTQSVVSMSGCTFNKNKASVSGGAIYTNSAKLTLTNCNFNQNTAKDCGGAIFIYHGTVKITGSNFNRNTAKRAGAAGFLCDNVIMSKSNFNNNVAKELGGAIYPKVKKHTVSKCKYVGNKASKSKDVYHKYKVTIKQTSKKYKKVKLTIKLSSSWSAPLNKKIKLKFKGSKNFKTGWIKVPSNGVLKLKVPVKLKVGKYNVVVSMDDGKCVQNSPKIKVVK